MGGLFESQRRNPGYILDTTGMSTEILRRNFSDDWPDIHPDGASLVPRRPILGLGVTALTKNQESEKTLNKPVELPETVPLGHIHPLTGSAMLSDHEFVLDNPTVNSIGNLDD